MNHNATAEEFYATPCGRMAASVLGARMAALWPSVAGASLLGIGYPSPYLAAWRGQAYACLAANQPRHAPPGGGLPGACTIDTDQLPFPDLTFDRIVLVHAVDTAGHADRLLREVWRVLKDDGRILVVAPNRMGLWAHIETTPFGQGHPYSHSQIRHLLSSAMFHVEKQDAALFLPPVNLSLMLRMARLAERAGRTLAPHLAGATITEAVKDAYAPLPVTAPARRRVILPEAA